MHVLLSDPRCGVAHELGDHLDGGSSLRQADAVGRPRGVEIDPLREAACVRNLKGESKPGAPQLRTLNNTRTDTGRMS